VRLAGETNTNLNLTLEGTSMKHSAIVLAALAAGGNALAQSSLPTPPVGAMTVFGVVDATYAHGQAGGGGTRLNQLTNSGHTSSRLGFRGTEDLGGGLSASFVLEAAVNVDNGTGVPSNSNNQASGFGAAGGLTFNRSSWGSLNGLWGSVRLGRDYDPQFWSITTFDPFTTLGVGASLINSGVTFANPSAIGPFAAATAAAPQVAFPGLQNVTRQRASNSFGYFTPNTLGGFYGWAQYSLGENASNAAAGANPPGSGKNDGKGLGARVGYMAGPFNGAIAYQATRNALLGDFKAWNAGASWNFGVAQVMALYHVDRAGGSTLAGGIGAREIEARSWQAGALVPIGVGQIRLAYSTYKLDLGPGADPQADKVAIGYVHHLSKRTAVYATYARLKNKNGANSTLNGSTPGSIANVNFTSSGYDIGVRHVF